MIATVTSQNQITIPSGVRRYADINPGDRILFVPVGGDGGKLEIIKLDTIESLRGSLGNRAIKRKYPTQEEIARAWVDDYGRKHSKNAKNIS